MKPIVCREMNGAVEEWICYKCPIVSAKRLTIEPGATVTVNDEAAYGFIAVQGTGTINGLTLSTPTLIHYGDLTDDEFFVTEDAAKRGVTIVNTSKTEPIVLLKHFAENPELTRLISK